MRHKNAFTASLLRLKILDRKLFGTAFCFNAVVRIRASLIRCNYDKRNRLFYNLLYMPPRVFFALTKKIKSARSFSSL